MGSESWLSIWFAAILWRSWFCLWMLNFSCAYWWRVSSRSLPCWRIFWTSGDMIVCELVNLNAKLLGSTIPRPPSRAGKLRSFRLRAFDGAQSRMAGMSLFWIEDSSGCKVSQENWVDLREKIHFPIVLCESWMGCLWLTTGDDR